MIKSLSNDIVLVIHDIICAEFNGTIAFEENETLHGILQSLTPLYANDDNIFKCVATLANEIFTKKPFKDNNLTFAMVISEYFLGHNDYKITANEQSFYEIIINTAYGINTPREYESWLKINSELIVKN